MSTLHVVPPTPHEPGLRRRLVVPPVRLADPRPSSARRPAPRARLSFRVDAATAQRLLTTFLDDDAVHAFATPLPDGSEVLVVHCPKRYDAVRRIRELVAESS